MRYKKALLLLFTGFITCLPGTTAFATEFSYRHQTLHISGESWTLRVPSHMQLEVLTADLDAPRLMTFLPNGDLLVGSRSGNIYLLEPPYRRPRVLINLPGYPHSVAYRDGMLMIARTGGLYRVPYTPGQQTLDRDELELLAPLPAGGGHNSRTVAIGPDNRIYVSLGISGNCSDEYLGNSYAFEARRGGLFVLDESSEKPVLKPYASGLRNPVGFDWHHRTGELYASNNGPDHLGFEQPPEYFSRLSAGSFHGMPWYQLNGNAIRRDNCIRGKPPRSIKEVEMPVATFPARNAPMGVVFVPEGAMDNRFHNNAVVALKGSWGTKPHGGYRGNPATRRPPRIMMVPFRHGKVMDAFDIVSGFQKPNGERLARPVGVAIGPDGALYITSDSETEGLFRLATIADDQVSSESHRPLSDN